MRRKADEPRAVSHYPQRNLKARLAKLLRERRHVLARFAEGDDAAEEDGDEAEEAAGDDEEDEAEEKDQEPAEATKEFKENVKLISSR